MPIKSRIRTIPDHPKPGILFRDITTLLGDHLGLRIAIESIAQHYKGERIQKVAGIEARGFILGGAIAHQLEAGFVPVRKQGKLPHETFDITYDLEYGTDTLEVHQDAFADGSKVLIVDDVLATGGTLAAASELIFKAGGEIVGAAMLLELTFLGGREHFGRRLHAALTY